MIRGALLVAAALVCMAAAPDNGSTEVVQARELLKQPNKNLLKARRLLESAAQKGSTTAHLMLADSYSASGSPEDRRVAHQHYLAAAQKGVARAMSVAAWMYETGTDAPRDAALAEKFYEAAAAQGDAYAIAQWNRYRWMETHDREANKTRTFRAAALGNPLAQIAASTLLLTEGGNDAQARAESQAYVDLLTANPSGSRDHADALFTLGTQYYFGGLRQRDGASAVKWLSAAMKENQDAAGLILAECYWKGFGATTNPVHAERLFDGALETSSVGQLNQVAWYLSVAPEAAARDGEHAVKLMIRVTQNAAGRTATYLDTLAAAYAETERFDLAVQAQNAALKLLPTNASPDVVSRMRKRLELYSQRTPYREPLG